RESLVRAEELSHPPSLAYALGFAAIHSNLRAEVERNSRTGRSTDGTFPQAGFYVLGGSRCYVSSVGTGQTGTAGRRDRRDTAESKGHSGCQESCETPPLNIT